MHERLVPAMISSQSLLAGDLPDVRVGIGRGTGRGVVEESVRAVGDDRAVVYDDPRLLVGDLVSGRIDAAVRGDLPSSEVLSLLRSATGVPALERLVLLEPAPGRTVFLAPVGIDECWTVEQKLDTVRRALELMRRLDAGGRVAVMSGGRAEDKGRCPAVDRSIDEADALVELLAAEGVDAYNSRIMIEEAVAEADLIIAPDGITGNIIFRTMHYLGGASALGAPVLNIAPVFVDTSRGKSDYTDALRLAMRLCGVTG